MVHFECILFPTAAVVLLESPEEFVHQLDEILRDPEQMVPVDPEELDADVQGRLHLVLNGRQKTGEQQKTKVLPCLSLMNLRSFSFRNYIS